MNVAPVSSVGVELLQPTSIKPAAEGFSEKLTHAVDAVDAMQGSADVKVENLASGKDVDLHGTMIALEKAEIALRTMVSVRDKLVDAYQQVMNMTL